MAHNHRPPLALRALVVALHGALALSASVGYAQAPAPAGQAPAGPSFDDPAVQELVRPTNTIEAGVIAVDSPSFKFGEYNGLHREGVRPLLDFDVRGGGAYRPETGSTQRWQVYGSRLGLPVRNFGGEFAEQGSWRIGFDYDELQRNFADDYLTIYRGAGTATLTLAPAFPGNNNIQTAATAARIATDSTRHDLQTQRRRLGLSGEVILSPVWSLSVGARHEKKDGTKFTGVAYGGQRGTFLPEPIDYETNIVETALRYRRGNDAHLTLGYNISLFTNRTDAWSAQNPFANNATFNNRVVMSGAPDNSMHQLTADGGWRFSPATKLSVSAAYAKMKQNEDFRFQQHPGQIVNNGATRVDAEQVQQNFLARLNHAVSRAFDVTGLFRYEHRDTRTPVGTYAFAAADPTATPPLAANRVVNNLPQNRRQSTFAVDGRYNLQPGSIVTAGVEHQRIHRSVDGPVNPLVSQENPFLSGEATQNTVRVGYRQSFNEALNGQINVSHSRREAGPYFDFPPTGTAAAPVFPQVPGFRQFFLASRDQDKVRASVDYQATEAWSVQGSLEYQQDRYRESTYGLQRSGMTTLTLDSTYAASDKLSFNGFVSLEDGETRARYYHLASGTATLGYTVNPACPATLPAGGPSGNMADPCRQWSVTQGDRVWTFGLGAKSAGHLGGKLTLTGDVQHSRARTDILFSGGTYSSARVFQPALNMPTITSRMTDFQFGARYELKKESAVRLGYLHRRLHSSDPQFDLFGLTTVNNFIGNGMNSPRYKVHAISVSYVHTFR